jgi:hypothetical protein
MPIASYPSPPQSATRTPTSSDTGRLTKNRTYLNGALAAQAYLKRTRTAMCTHGQCRPGMLREQLQVFCAQSFPAAFVKGFVDAIDAYVVGPEQFPQPLQDKDLRPKRRCCNCRNQAY